MALRSAKRHTAPMSGWPGLPSYSTTVEPSSRPPTRKFHIIQPVVVNQKKRSAGPRSSCSEIDFSSSRAIPPCPWTIALGSPVVPEEYSTHSGWSKATGSKASSAPAPSSSSRSQATVPSRRVCGGPPARPADQDGGLKGGEPPADIGQSVAPVVPGAVVAVAVDRHQHLGLDLGEAVDHAGDAELRGAARPDGADAGRGQHGDHGLGHVGQVGDHPVALGHPEPAKPGRDRRHPPAQLRVADRAQLAGLVAEQQRRVVVVAAQRQLGVVEGRPREPARPRHPPLGQGRARGRPADLEELPDRAPEPVQVVH